MSPPIELDAEILERVRAVCLALPEVTVRVDESRSSRRSTAHSFDIRRRSFCLLIAIRGPRTGGSVPLLVLRVELVTDSYRIIAPRKLTALLDE